MKSEGYLISYNSKLWKRLVEVVEIASETLRQSFERGREVSELKEDLSPVCDADLAIHDYLNIVLPEILALPVVSEEQPSRTLSRERLWLIDPLDGTKDFLSGIPNFCINIAIVEDGRVILGIIADPMDRRIYFACENEGAFEKDTQNVWKKMQSERPLEHKMVTSRSHSSALELRFQEEKKIKERAVMGSALKFIKLIKGECSLYPRFVPCRTWDVAAGHCLLKEVGGDILNFNTGESLQYLSPWDKNMAPFLAMAFPIENKELIHLRDFNL